MEFELDAGGARLSGDDAGEGAPVVLLHGLTATRRYVVMGSRMLERGGHRVVADDARGHGRSGPAPSPEAYGYDDLADDLLAVLDDRGIDRAVLAGASMGAHTLVRLALERPERVAGLVVATPAFDPDVTAPRLEHWDVLSRGLREGGVDGFVVAYGHDEDRIHLLPLVYPEPMSGLAISTSGDERNMPTRSTRFLRKTRLSR